MIGDFINFANGILWGKVLIYALIGAGIYFTFSLRLIQVRHFGHMFKVMFGSRSTENDGISSFQAFCTSLAARVGTGNLAGIGVAIYVGGPGAIFWMWLIALLGMSTSFAESTLAQVYKVKNEDGTTRGGPAYYMEQGLGLRWMGIIFAILLIIAVGMTFSSVQANSISAAMAKAFGFNKTIVGVGIVIITASIIFGGIRAISRFAEMVVPFMAVLYLAVALFVVFTNLDRLPAVLELVISCAFGLKQAAAGGLGYAMSKAVMNGVKRGLFSNEAGLGTAPNAAATADVKHPASQGMVQMLGVFTDTIVICTATAAIILLSGKLEPGSGLTGIELTQAALSAEVGSWANSFIAICILFFAFTSIIANYYFGEANLAFISNDKKAILGYRVVVLAVVMFGAISKIQLVWDMADLFMGLMAVVNLIAIVKLSPIVIKVLRDYDTQLKEGKEPVFTRNSIPELDQILEKGIWEDSNGKSKKVS